MIQLFARIEDILPTEWWVLRAPDKFMDPEEAVLAENDMDCKKTWLYDISRNGITYQLKVHPSGHIADGNCRYWCARARHTYISPLPHRAGFLPVDVKFFTGFYPHDNWRVKEPVFAMNPTYPNTDHLTKDAANKYNFRPEEMFQGAFLRKRKI